MMAPFDGSLPGRVAIRPPSSGRFSGVKTLSSLSLKPAAFSRAAMRLRRQGAIADAVAGVGFDELLVERAEGGFAGCRLGQGGRGGRKGDGSRGGGGKQMAQRRFPNLLQPVWRQSRCRSNPPKLP